MDQETFNFLVSNQKIWREQYEKNKKNEYADKLSKFAVYRNKSRLLLLKSKKIV